MSGSLVPAPVLIWRRNTWECASLSCLFHFTQCSTTVLDSNTLRQALGTQLEICASHQARINKTDWVYDWLIHWLTGRNSMVLTDWLTGRLAGWLAETVSNGLAGSVIEWLIDRLLDSKMGEAKTDPFVVFTSSVMRIHPQQHCDWIFSTPFLSLPSVCGGITKPAPNTGKWAGSADEGKRFKEAIRVGGTEVMKWSKQVPFSLYAHIEADTHTHTQRHSHRTNRHHSQVQGSSNCRRKIHSLNSSCIYEFFAKLKQQPC